MIIKPKCGMFKGMFKGMGLCAADKVVSAGPSYLLSEGFEGAGYENAGWVESAGGTKNEDYATEALEGSQSLYITTDSGRVYSYHNFTATDPVYVYFMWQFDSGTALGNQMIMSLTDTSDTNCLRIMVNDSEVYIYHGTTGSSVAFSWVKGTTYHIWADYAKGTGANGVGNVFISANTTKPAANITITEGNGTATASRIYLEYEAVYSDEVFLFDKIRVNSSDIGSAPD